MGKNNMLPRICKTCGAAFLGGPRAWYCQPCRDERKKKHNAEFKRRKRAGQVIPLGSVIKCEICGKEITKTGSASKFCDICAAAHLKTIDNQQSIDWKRSNPDKYKAIKKAFRDKRYTDEEQKKPAIKGVIWEKEHCKWQANVCIKGKQYKILRTNDKNLAIKARKEAEELKKAGKLTPEELLNLRKKYRDFA